MTIRVVKLGGSVLTEPILQDALAREIVALTRTETVVVVHGGGPQIDLTLPRFELASHFVDGHRVTSPEVMDVITMVLVGKVRQSLIATLNRHSAGRAVGLTGCDGNMFQVTPSAEAVWGRVGTADRVDVSILTQLTESGHIPVLSPIGAGSDHETYNVNGDSFAAAIAIALEADELTLVSDVDGIYADVNDPSTLFHRLGIDELRALASEVRGGMIPKCAAMLDALSSGVGRVRICNGQNPNALTTTGDCTVVESAQFQSAG